MNRISHVSSLLWMALFVVAGNQGARAADVPAASADIITAAPDQKPADKAVSTHDPIEVTSDTLDVFQAENRAVFTGHVIAIQGDMRLESDKMIVYYTKPPSEKDKTAGPKPPKSSQGTSPVQQDAIEKIEVEGHVFVSNPTDTAKGDNGLYVTATHTIYLNDNVVLTHGNNVLNGDKLIYNLDTGKSRLIGKATSTDQSNEEKPRVRALFVPDNKDKKPDKAGSNGNKPGAPANVTNNTNNNVNTTGTGSTNNNATVKTP